MVVTRKSDGPVSPQVEARLKSLAGEARAAPPASPSFEESRVAPRATTFRAAHIEIGAGALVPCLIRDANRFGVRVTLEGARELPYCVTLILAATGERKTAYVAWKRDNEAGLSFSSRPPALSAPFGKGG